MASKNNNRQMVPEARQALDDMKFEIARELGVDVKGYGGASSIADLSVAVATKIVGEALEDDAEQKKLIEQAQRQLSNK